MRRSYSDEGRIRKKEYWNRRSLVHDMPPVSITPVADEDESLISNDKTIIRPNAKTFQKRNSLDDDVNIDSNDYPRGKKSLKRTITPENDSNANESNKSKKLKSIDDVLKITTETTEEDTDTLISSATANTSNREVHRYPTYDRFGVMLQMLDHGAIDRDVSNGAAEILKKNEVSEQCNNPSSRKTERTREIELMRTPRVQRPRPSIGSLQAVADDILIDQEAPEEEQRTDKALTEVNSGTREIKVMRMSRAQASIFGYNIHDDEEEPEEEQITLEAHTESSTSDKSSVIISSSTLSKRASEYERTRRILNGIFVGVPRVFNICSCNNQDK